MGKDHDLLEAARSGNAVVVEKLLSLKTKRGGPLASLRRGPGPNVQDASGYSSLHHAALNGHLEIVALLLENEASPNLVDNKGSTALHLAAWAGHSDIVRLILTTGNHVVQINLKNKNNETALHCAAQYGHTAVINLLLSHGADPSIRNVKDETALNLAAHYGRLETVKILLKKHPNLIDAYRPTLATGSCLHTTTPLHSASRNGHRAVVDVLLRAGFPVSLQTPDGTALHEATSCGKVDVVRRLLEAGIDVRCRNAKRGETALQIVQALPPSLHVAQEITSLIQNSALLVNVASAKPSSAREAAASSYENVTLSRPSRKSCSSSSSVSSASAAPESFITLPRQRHQRASTSSANSEKSNASVYEVPPPPRSLPWLQRPAPASDTETEDTLTLSSSPSDFLSDDSSTLNLSVGGSDVIDADRLLSRSFDERCIDPMSLSMFSCPAGGSFGDTDLSSCSSTLTIDANCNAFTRSSRCRSSIDQYLPMSGSTKTKLSPNPPAKPPRLRNQGLSSASSVASAVSSSVASVAASAAPVSSSSSSSSAHKTGHRSATNAATDAAGLTGSSSGYELVYLARTGSRVDAADVASADAEAPSAAKFRVHSGYVDMAPVAAPRSIGRVRAAFSSYENVELPVQEPDYDIPRQHSSGRAYENVQLATSASPATTTAAPEASTTPPTPTTPMTPPTPDHPPPPAHQAEQRIHDCILPLTQDGKRKSRDIETETEEELFATGPAPVSHAGSSEEEPATPLTSSGSPLSLSLSTSDKSISADCIEEITGDEPFAGLMRGSVQLLGSRKSSMERPRSLRTGLTAGDNDSSSSSRSISSGSSSRCRGGSLSVLSPFDEQEEWTKIWEILGSFSNGFGGPESPHLVQEVQREFQNRIDLMNGAQTTPSNCDDESVEVPVVGRPNTVSDWLLLLGLTQYLSLLTANGFDDIDFLGDGILNDSSLRQLGVACDEHRSRLVAAASALPTPLHKMTTCPPSDVAEWLQLLRLSRYLGHFQRNCYDDLERVRRVWEVELTTVIEIREVGHLRRILVSLAGDRPQPSDPPAGDRPQPSNSPAGGRPQPTPTLERSVSTTSAPSLNKLTTELQKITTSIAQLEDEISQKMRATGDNGTVALNQNTTTLNRKKSRPAPQPPSTSSRRSDALLQKLLDELAIRDPSQLLMGIAQSVETQWRHQPQKLIHPGVSYQAQYLGSTLVRHLRGTESTKRSIEKLKAKTPSGPSPTNGCYGCTMILAISLSGVLFLEASTQETICKHEIRNIHCACQDADDMTHFAYITKDHETLQHYCHVFRVPTMDLATEIILTLGQAFEVAYQLVLRDQERAAKEMAKCRPSSDVSLASVGSASVPTVATTATPISNEFRAPTGDSIGEPRGSAAAPKSVANGRAERLRKNLSHARSTSMATVATAEAAASGPSQPQFSAMVMKKSKSTTAAAIGRAPLAAGEEL